MVKQRLTTADVAAEVACLRRRIVGMRVANVYDINPKTYVLKLARSGEDGEKVLLVVESGVRLHTIEASAWPPQPAGVRPPPPLPWIPVHMRASPRATLRRRRSARPPLAPKGPSPALRCPAAPCAYERSRCLPRRTPPLHLRSRSGGTSGLGAWSRCGSWAWTEW